MARRRRRRATRRRAESLALLSLSALLALVSLVSLVGGPVRPRLGEGDAEPAAETSAPAAGSASGQGTSTQDADAATREAYVETWGARIDAFDAGTPLAGYGRTFAAAAYDCGVDPRFAPAIARVESGSGANCAYACNAWGWGSSSWGDWDTAIWEYTAALGAQYGRTLTFEAALSYNEVTPDAWYAEVEASMYQIWESDSL